MVSSAGENEKSLNLVNLRLLKLYGELKFLLFHGN